MVGHKRCTLSESKCIKLSRQDRGNLKLVGPAYALTSRAVLPILTVIDRIRLEEQSSAYSLVQLVYIRTMAVNRGAACVAGTATSDARRVGRSATRLWRVRRACPPQGGRRAPRDGARRAPGGAPEAKKMRCMREYMPENQLLIATKCV